MDGPDEAALSALDQERANARIGSAAGAGERIGFARRKNIAHRSKCAGMLLDVIGERPDPRRSLDRLRLGLRRGNRRPERMGESGIDPAGLGEMIKRCALVEPAHLDRPFNRRAFTIELEPTIGAAGNGHNAAVDLRGKRLVDLQLGLTGRFAFCQRRIIQKGKTH